MHSRRSRLRAAPRAPWPALGACRSPHSRGSVRCGERRQRCSSVARDAATAHSSCNSARPNTTSGTRANAQARAQACTRATACATATRRQTQRAREAERARERERERTKRDAPLLDFGELLLLNATRLFARLFALFATPLNCLQFCNEQSDRSAPPHARTSPHARTHKNKKAK